MAFLAFLVFYGYCIYTDVEGALFVFGLGISPWSLGKKSAEVQPMQK